MDLSLFSAERETLEVCHRTLLICTFQVCGYAKVAVLDEFLIKQALFFVELFHAAFGDAFKYGIDIMKGMGMSVEKIHAGHANMFLSPIFRETLAGVTGAVIELYDTDGSVGAAKGAGMGVGIYKNSSEAFATLDKLDVIEPKESDRAAYEDAYGRWLDCLNRL